MSKFEKGKSGNPAGKPRGALNVTTRAAQALIDNEGEALTRVCIDLAKGGNLAALRLCMERLIPVRRAMPIDLPDANEAYDAHKITAALLGAVGRGELSATDAATIAGLAVEHCDVIRRNENAKQFDEMFSFQAARPVRHGK